MNLSAEMPLGTFRHPDEIDPFVLRRISAHDLVRAVGRAVADDDPFRWLHRLPHHRLDGQFNERRLVSRRRNENVDIVAGSSLRRARSPDWLSCGTHASASAVTLEPMP